MVFSAKLALIVRTDLSMKKGKIASQCCHAALACYRTSIQKFPRIVKKWENIGEPKVVLKCGSEHELELLQSAAEKEGLVAILIQDAGKTQVEIGTTTTLGIGPAEHEKIDKIVGHLKLL